MTEAEARVAAAEAAAAESKQSEIATLNERLTKVRGHAKVWKAECQKARAAKTSAEASLKKASADLDVAREAEAKVIVGAVLGVWGGKMAGMCSPPPPSFSFQMICARWTGACHGRSIQEQASGCRKGGGGP